LVHFDTGLRSSAEFLRFPKRISIMRYRVVLSRNEDGYTVHCPGLPGCWSQGETEEEALENIASAIEEYLAAIADLTVGEEIREVEVAVG
jgi:predicted RNase H-like HicB family nuclease